MTADIAKKRDAFALMLFHDNAVIVDGNKTLGSPDRVLHYYDIKLIEKYHGLSYEGMADRIAMLMNTPQLRLNTDLLVDGTGVGDAAVEMIRKRGLYPIPIIFGGGNEPREHYAQFGSIFNNTPGALAGAKTLDYISIPKKDLVDAGKVMVQQGRLRVAPGRWNDDFQKQLLKFKGKVNEATNRTKYEAETEQDHDDLVVVFLMGSWFILNRKEKGVREQTANENISVGWEPDQFC